MTNIIASFKKLARDERGATAIEYGLIAGVMAVAIIAAFTVFDGALQSTMSSIAAAMKGG